MNVTPEGELPIETESDIVMARRTVRELALQLEFGATDVTRIVTAASELARNIFHYAGKGTMHWSSIENSGGYGLQLRFADRGPGISDVELALSEGFSTGTGHGMGLPGARRLMDEMEIESKPNEGTTIIVRKWRKGQPR